MPTAVVPRGAAADLAALKRARGWPDVVVKPAVGGSSRDTVHEARASGAAAAQQLRALAPREDTVGSRSSPRCSTTASCRSCTWAASSATPSQAGGGGRLARAERLRRHAAGVEPADYVRAAADPPARGPAGVNARVDVLEDGDGALVIEHELIDCELFLSTAPGAAHRFADALLAGAQGRACDRQPPG